VIAIRETKPRTKETIPMGMKTKLMRVEKRVRIMKINEGLSRLADRCLIERIMGLLNEKRKASAPTIPVVEIRVSRKLPDSTKRRFHNVLSRFR